MNASEVIVLSLDAALAHQLWTEKLKSLATEASQKAQEYGKSWCVAKIRHDRGDWRNEVLTLSLAIEKGGLIEAIAYADGQVLFDV